MTVTAHDKTITDLLASARHPRFKPSAARDACSY